LLGVLVTGVVVEWVAGAAALAEATGADFTALEVLVRAGLLGVRADFCPIRLVSCGEIAAA
jgi:hypothetical protein